MALKNVDVEADVVARITEHVEMMRNAGEKKVSVKSVMEELIRVGSITLGQESNGFKYVPPELTQLLDIGLRASVAVIGRDAEGVVYPSVVFLGAFGWCDNGDFGKKVSITAWKYKVSVPPPPPQ